jgi:hypothetical protein
MALAILLTLQRDVPDAPPTPKAATGKAMARELEKLDFLARSNKVPQPSTLLSEPQAALIAQLTADGFDVSKMRLPPERWLPASEGLQLLAALIAHLEAKPNDAKQPSAVLRDLRAAEATLKAADAAGVAFHFTKADV